MNTALLIIAILAGILGGACVLAGILLLRDLPGSDTHNKSQRGRLIGELLDGLIIFGVIMTSYDATKNWSRRRDARRFIYAGLGGLLLMSAALYFR